MKPTPSSRPPMVDTYVAGETYFDVGDSKAWVIKLDAKGNVQWRKTYISEGGAKSIQQTYDGG